jgi:hypothetical protein
MIIAFRRHHSPYAAFTCRPYEINPTATYQITTAQTYTPTPPKRLLGSELQGIKAEIDNQPGSVIITYRQVSEDE